MNLKLIESFVELIELGAFANNQDIVKGLNSAIKVTKEQTELTDGEIERIYFQTESVWDKDGNFQYLAFARAILRKAQDK